MKSKDLEIRNIGSIEYENRDENNRHVEGYAIVFESQSQDLGFYETIDRNAVTQELIDSCDVFALMNHDDEKVLARRNKGKGSLTLTLDERGLRYSFDAPKTNLGDELLEYLRRGEVDGSSFAFIVDSNDPDSQTWERKNGTTYRTIHKIKYIHDVSPVFTPAYTAASVSQRALDKCIELEEIERKQAEKDEEDRKQSIYSHLDEKMKEIDEISKI